MSIDDQITFVSPLPWNIIYYLEGRMKAMYIYWLGNNFDIELREKKCKQTLFCGMYFVTGCTWPHESTFAYWHLTGKDLFSHFVPNKISFTSWGQ